MQAAHLRDFAGFDIVFDNYGSTNSPENRRYATRSGGLCARPDDRENGRSCSTTPARFWPIGLCRDLSQLRPDRPTGRQLRQVRFDLPGHRLDRSDQRAFGRHSRDRDPKHLFVELNNCTTSLQWTQSGEHLQAEVANYLKGHFLNEPLKDWDVSRPAPYFGFEIPDSPGNYWYVWFDAPIGYMGSTQQWCGARRVFRRLVAVRTRRSTTSSARTSLTSTRCSGPACCTWPVSTCLIRCTSTAS